MAKKYENMNDYNPESESKKKRLTLNPFENMFSKDGKGVEKDEIKVLDKPGLGNFFKLLQRKLNHIFSVNILLIFGNFPIFFGLLAFAYTLGEAMAPASQMYPLLRGASYFNSSPVIMTLLGTLGKQNTVPVPSTASYILFGLTLLVFITFGLVNVGTTYIIRNLIRGEQVYVMGDFWYAIKKKATSRKHILTIVPIISFSLNGFVGTMIQFCEIGKLNPKSIATVKAIKTVPTNNVLYLYVSYITDFCIAKLRFYFNLCKRATIYHLRFASSSFLLRLAVIAFENISERPSFSNTS